MNLLCNNSLTDLFACKWRDGEAERRKKYINKTNDRRLHIDVAAAQHSMRMRMALKQRKKLANRKPDKRPPKKTDGIWRRDGLYAPHTQQGHGPQQRHGGSRHCASACCTRARAVRAGCRLPARGLRGARRRRGGATVGWQRQVAQLGARRQGLGER